MSLHFHSKTEREDAEVTLRTATSGASRRAGEPVSSMALSNVLETPAAGFNFDNTARYELLFMSSEQQTVSFNKTDQINAVYTARYQAGVKSESNFFPACFRVYSVT